MGSNRKQTAINLITGIFSMVVTLLINFFLSSFIVEKLGEEANGFTQLANNFVTYASLITIAFNSMAARFIAVYYHQNEKEKINRYYSSIIICNIFILLLMIPCAILCVMHLDSLINIENADVLHVKILFACVFLNFFINLFVSIFNIATFVLNRIYIQNTINAIKIFLNGLLLLLVFRFLSPRLYYVSLCSLVLTALVLPICWWVQKKLIPQFHFSLKLFDLGAIKSMLKSGIWNTVNQGGNMLMTGLDLLLANLFVSPEKMGVLSVSKIFPNAIILLGTTLNSNFMPETLVYYSQNDTKALLKSLRSNMKISSVLMSIPVVTFCCFGIPFYSLWVPSLNPKELTLLSFLTCLAFIPCAGTQTLNNVFTVTNHLKVSSISFLVSGILNVGVVYILLSTTNLGVLAIAGISSIISIVRNVVVIMPYTAKLLNLPWYEFYKDVVIALICCTINLVVAELVLHFIHISGWVSLIMSVFITCSSTILLDLLLVLSKEERKKILQRIKK